MLEQYQRVYARVDLDAIRHNVEEIERVTDPHTKIMGVIKTDGYGHGAVPIARELDARERIFGFGTATVEEAVILRKAGIQKALLVLGYTFPYCYEDLVKYQIRPAVFRLDMAERLEACAAKLGSKLPVHIKVDTGMNRIGIRPDEEGLEFVRKVSAFSHIEIEGIFTHFAKADETDKNHANGQLDVFNGFVRRVERELGFRIPVRHCSNSAGILDMPHANLDMVRAGIILYGLWPSDEVRRDVVSLQPALTLKSHIVYVKNLEPGCGISYNGIFTTERATRVATVPVGYGDGYPRGLSNKGSVLIAGRRAPILGRICMDQFMVDVTDIPEAIEGAEVTLLGADGEDSITMEEAGAVCGRFNYELACDLGKRIPYVYTRNGEIVCTKDYFDDI